MDSLENRIAINFFGIYIYLFKTIQEVIRIEVYILTITFSTQTDSVAVLDSLQNCELAL
jgi:hypothetical protein